MNRKHRNLNYLARAVVTFAKDPTGTRCPFGAHMHRANPRNTDYRGDRPVSRNSSPCSGLVQKVFAMI